MSTVTGRFVDVNTGKGIPYVEVDVYGSADQSGTPAYSMQGNQDGTFSDTSNYYDIPNASFNVNPPGYTDMAGTISNLNGTIQLYPTGTTTTTTVIPAWAWVLLSLLVIWGGWYLYKKGKLKF
jgi:hypothetical protein